MFVPSLFGDGSAFPTELIAYSVQSAEAKATGQLRSIFTLSRSGISNYAPPMMPLRERDSIAMQGFFEREDLEEIAADIEHNLGQLYPEPVWDDDHWEFLQDFL